MVAQTILAEFAHQNVRVSIDNDEWQFNSHHLDELEKSDLKVTVIPQVVLSRARKNGPATSGHPILGLRGEM